jgi:hypothetical protein
MLMDEADCTVTFDGALVRVKGTERDVRERGFSRTVFTNQCMDDTGLELEIDAFHGDDFTEALDDAAKRERGR